MTYLLELASGVAVVIAAALLLGSSAIRRSWGKTPVWLRKRWSNLTVLVGAFFVGYMVIGLALHAGVPVSPLVLTSALGMGAITIIWSITRLVRLTATHVGQLAEDFRDLVESTHALVQSIAPDGRFIWVNRAWRERLGFAEDELATLTFLDLVRPDLRDEARAVLDRQDVETAVPFETVLIAKDGRALAVEGSMSWRTRAGETVAARSVFHDVTEQRAARHALQRSEGKLRGLFESMTEGVAFHEMVRDDTGTAIDYRFVDVNSAFERHTGLRRGEVIGRTARQVFGTDYAPYLDHLYEPVIVRRQTLSFETFQESLNRFFRLSVSPIAPDGFTSVFEDISERKRSERRLRRSEMRLRASAELARMESESEEELLTAALPHVSELVDSPTVYLITPAGPGEGTLRTWLSDVGAVKSRSCTLDDAEMPWAECLRAGLTVINNRRTSLPGRGRETEWMPRLVRHACCCTLQDDRPAILLGVANREQDYDGDDAELLQIFVDRLWEIVVRRRAQQALRVSEARARAIYQHIPIPSLIWQRQDDGGIVLLEMNAAARGAGLLESQDTASIACLPTQLSQDAARCVTDQCTIRRELTVGIKGQPRIMLSACGFVPPDRAVMHLQDHTEERRLTEQLMLSQKLEGIGRLAGGVAHDFNNIVSVILSNTAFASKGMPAGDPLQNELGEVRKAAERAAALTRQLLAFSRRQVLKPEIISINRVVVGMEPMLRRLLGEDIDLNVTLSSELDSVKADPGQIEQVIMNLAVNSRDAMPKGGKLTVETKNVRLDEGYAQAHVSVGPGDYVMLAVSDSGCGMDEGTRAKVFEPFFTTKKSSGGTGLGLATTYGIVKQSGGNIWVYSEPGVGSTFKVYLPREVAEPVEHSEPIVLAPGSGGNEVIVLAEDDQAVRRAARRILSEAGYRVLSAANGKEALQIIEERRGDVKLLLTDVVMPQMGGSELAERARELVPALRIVYMSGYTDEAIVRHGILQKGTEFVSKPFNDVDLARKVREVLDRV